MVVAPGGGVDWGDQHDRLLTFVFRVFDCCVRDADAASALTVELFGRHHQLVDSPDLDDADTRALVVGAMSAALRERFSRAAIRVAVGHAAWQDRMAAVKGAGATEWHGLLAWVRAFTGDLRLT
ncbi:hypothetical protein [Actinokineospora pegani]|uniref:hypothetical protein n=1 Tax=Actinokineospora pegani TaxID=2654637 RepID=UPI0012EA1521|nr:hypothetical protein [Actinokineospora pegani]